jgi:2,3-dihydroxybiphenyl 1,2-dioxygenase
MAELLKLDYVVIHASDLAAWQDFATSIAGMTVGASNGTLALRLDEHPWRILVEQGSEDDLVCAGWDLGTSADLDDYVAGLRAKGLEVHEESANRAGSRCVTRLFSTVDPNGVTHEFYCGRTGLAPVMASPVLRGGFNTGDLGIGHILPVARDYAESLNYYQDLLGLRYSDRIRQEMAPGIYADATFFHSATGRHHSLATGQFPSPKRLNHLMLEFEDMNDVGAAYDRALAAGVPIVLELGHHPNDQMFSFYMRTPSGFGLELGYGGVVIDDATWEPRLYDHMSDWGHKRRMNMVD